MNTDRTHDMSDQELLDRFYADRSTAWLGILLQRYTLLLLGVCMKYLKNEEESKDCVQQIFLKVIPELNKYKVEYFKSWLYTVARNHCLMKIRDSQGRKPVSITEKTVIAAEEEPDKQKILEKERLLEMMEQTLNELNKEQKWCLTLFYLEKKSYQEISADTGYSLMQVKSYIQNGKRNMKQLLDKKLQQGG